MLQHSMTLPAPNRTGAPANAQLALERLLQHLVEDGDRRAIVAGRRARRALADMTAPASPARPGRAEAGADDACGLCGYWTCRCGQAAVGRTGFAGAVV